MSLSQKLFGEIVEVVKPSIKEPFKIVKFTPAIYPIKGDDGIKTVGELRLKHDGADFITITIYFMSEYLNVALKTDWNMPNLDDFEVFKNEEMDELVDGIEDMQMERMKCLNLETQEEVTFEEVKDLFREFAENVK